MSRSDPSVAGAAWDRLPPSGSAEAPSFAEPWEAQAFALAVHLHRTGAFTWSEWAAALGAEIRHGEGPGDPAEEAGDYAHWLTALERLALGRGLVGADALAERTLAWAEAYRHTPHGSPVAPPMTSSADSPQERAVVAAACGSA